MRRIIIVVVVLAASGRAQAYPQYQLSRDVTCTSCHLAPGGGGLVTENGIAVADATAWRDGDAEFLHGLPVPSWLELGGDIRAAAGAVGNGSLTGAAYPMQAEVYAAAGARGFTVNVTAGLRRPQEDGNAAHVVWSREHYVMWQQHPGASDGLYARAGRFMPVYGLRLAEHVVYTQRYGGMPLYGEAYAAAVEYVHKRFEAHATGFVHDRIATAVEHGDGGALYAEARVGDHAAVGFEAKYAGDGDLHRTYAGVVGKLYLPGADVLLQAEGELVHRRIVAGGTVDQLIGYALASRPLRRDLLLDVGIGHYAADLSVRGLIRDCLDVNLHWFATSHLEALVTSRLELLDLGGSPTGGYALVQLHYRL